MIVSGIFRINPEMSRCVTQKHSYQILNGPAANWGDFFSHSILFVLMLMKRKGLHTFN